MTLLGYYIQRRYTLITRVSRLLAILYMKGVRAGNGSFRAADLYPFLVGHLYRVLASGTLF